MTLHFYTQRIYNASLSTSINLSETAASKLSVHQLKPADRYVHKSVCASFIERRWINAKVISKQADAVNGGGHSCNNVDNNANASVFWKVSNI